MHGPHQTIRDPSLQSCLRPDSGACEPRSGCQTKATAGSVPPWKLCDLGIQITCSICPHPSLGHIPAGARLQQEAWRGPGMQESRAAPRGSGGPSRVRSSSRPQEAGAAVALWAAGAAVHFSGSQRSFRFNPPSSTTFLDVLLPTIHTHTHTHTRARAKVQCLGS